MPVEAMPISQPEESEAERIARGLRRRDLPLVKELVERYQYRLVRYLMFLTARREFVEDWTQETWVRVSTGEHNATAGRDSSLAVLDRAARGDRRPAAAGIQSGRGYHPQCRIVFPLSAHSAQIAVCGIQTGLVSGHEFTRAKKVEKAPAV